MRMDVAAWLSLFFLQVRWTLRSILRLCGGQLSPWRWWVFPANPRRRGAGQRRRPIGKLFRWGGRRRRQQHEQQQQQQHHRPGSSLHWSGTSCQPWTQNHPNCQQPQQRLQGRWINWRKQHSGSLIVVTDKFQYFRCSALKKSDGSFCFYPSEALTTVWSTF